MPKFRKKPVVIEAIQWDGLVDAHVTIEDWVGDGIQANFTQPGVPIIIPTLEGDMKAHLGDWIIKGVKGEVYPCRDDTFKATYEPVDEKQKETP
jgi:hypothetical protein